MREWVEFWNYTTADWAGLQFAVLVAAAYFALRQTSEARRVREEQARPHVLIDLVIWNTIAEFRITNIGKTIARGVQFHFDPPLVTSHDSDGNGLPLAEMNLFKRGIPSLAPGAVVQGLFDQLPSRMERQLPDDYEVRVSYSDAGGGEYSETMTVGYSYLRDFGRMRRRDLHDLYKKVEDIAKELKRWTVLGRGIQVMTPKDVQDYRRRMEERWAEQEAEESGSQEGDEIEQLQPDGHVAVSGEADQEAVAEESEQPGDPEMERR